MSNRVYFQTTKFVDLDKDLREISEEYGYRIYDDYESDYANYLTVEQLPQTAKEAFELIKKHDGLHESAVLKGSFYFNEEFIELNSEGEVE